LALDALESLPPGIPSERQKGDQHSGVADLLRVPVYCGGEENGGDARTD
jgi:hypothetical protein